MPEVNQTEEQQEQPAPIGVRPGLTDEAGTTTTTINGLEAQIRAMTIRTGRFGAQGITGTINALPQMPEPFTQEEEDITISPKEALDYINNVYGLTLDKNNKIGGYKKEVIIEEAAPICEEEELVVNIKELADQMTKDLLELKHGHFNEETMIDEYINLYETVEEKIKANQRKINV